MTQPSCIWPACRNEIEHLRQVAASDGETIESYEIENAELKETIAELEATLRLACERLTYELGGDCPSVIDEPAFERDCTICDVPEAECWAGHFRALARKEIPFEPDRN